MIVDVGFYRGSLCFSVVSAPGKAWFAETPCGFLSGLPSFKALKDEIDACLDSGAANPQYVPRFPPNLKTQLEQLKEEDGREAVLNVLSSIFLEIDVPEEVGECRIVKITLVNGDELYLIFDADDNCIGCSETRTGALELAASLGLNVPRGPVP